MEVIRLDEELVLKTSGAVNPCEFESHRLLYKIYRRLVKTTTVEYNRLIAEVAQLVERQFCKLNVTGSFPVFGSAQ